MKGYYLISYEDGYGNNREAAFRSLEKITEAFYDLISDRKRNRKLDNFWIEDTDKNIIKAYDNEERCEINPDDYNGP